MDFTFGIITSENADNFISTIIDSIVKNNIPNYEIIIVGNTKVDNHWITYIPSTTNLLEKLEIFLV